MPDLGLKSSQGLFFKNAKFTQDIIYYVNNNLLFIYSIEFIYINMDILSIILYTLTNVYTVMSTAKSLCIQSLLTPATLENH